MIEYRKQVITENSKIDLFNKVKDLCLLNNNTIPQDLIAYLFTDEFIFDERFTSFDAIAIVLYTALVTYHIPIYGTINENGKRELVHRPIGNTWTGAMAFNFAYLDENEVLKYSHRPGSILPPLTFGDKDRNLLEGTMGKVNPDFHAENDIKDSYELKHDYFNSKSPSSLHRAKHLINCLPDGSIEVYDLEKGEIKQETKRIGTGLTFIQRKGHYMPKWMNFSDWEIIKSGSLILDLDDFLEEQGIVWKWTR